MLLKWTDPKKFHWCPDTVHLYMANCDIIGLLQKYAERLIFFDLVDAKYEYQKEDLRLANGQVEKAGSQNGTFMLGNRDYGDGEVDLLGIMRILKKVKFGGISTSRVAAQAQSRGPRRVANSVNMEGISGS